MSSQEKQHIRLEKIAFELGIRCSAGSIEHQRETPAIGLFPPYGYLCRDCLESISRLLKGEA